MPNTEPDVGLHLTTLDHELSQNQETDAYPTEPPRSSSGKYLRVQLLGKNTFQYECTIYMAMNNECMSIRCSTFVSIVSTIGVYNVNNCSGFVAVSCFNYHFPND